MTKLFGHPRRYPYWEAAVQTVWSCTGGVLSLWSAAVAVPVAAAMPVTVVRSGR